jgi:lipid-A-disaccharide synthase-like uncharacterized protein
MPMYNLNINFDKCNKICKKLNPTVLDHLENRSNELFWQLLSLLCSTLFTGQRFLIRQIRLSRHFTSPDPLTVKV